MSVALKAGSNLVVYTGKAQSASNAFASIISYLEVVYYWNNVTNDYELVITTTTMVPYGVYSIDVTQNCTWTYGADATPPTSVQLYSKLSDTTTHGANIVAYSGPSQSVEDAFASIWDYWLGAMYYNNTTKYWEQVLSGYVMVPNIPYLVWVDRNCVWTFAAPELVPCEITITAPNSAAEGEKVSVSALLKNVSSYGYMYKTEIYAVPDLFPAFRIGTIEKYINSGSSFTAYGSFTMPASNTTILIWVERWAVDHWVYDNSASKVVSLEVVPEYKGSIARKELEYDETRGAIPVY